jgi:hypothetical protein
MNWIEEYQKVLNTDWKPTSLDSKEEKEFQQWLKNTEMFKDFKTDIATENNIPITQVDDSRLFEMLTGSPDYDYRGAWKAGIKEERSPYDNRIHLPSVSPEGALLKSPQHPTMWKEFFMRQHKIDPDSLGLDTFDKAIKWKPEFADIFSDPFPNTTK